MKKTVLGLGGFCIEKIVVFVIGIEILEVGLYLFLISMGKYGYSCLKVEILNSPRRGRRRL